MLLDFNFFSMAGDDKTSLKLIESGGISVTLFFMVIMAVLGFLV